MKILNVGVSTLALLAGLTGTAMAEGLTAWRLFVSDHAAPVVHVIDAVKKRNAGNVRHQGAGRALPQRKW